MTPTTTMFFTIAICAIILLLLFYFLSKPTIKNVTTVPSILTGIGIFGTFLGITISLMYFNPDNILASVPIFLSGIKLAFWSSVVGILASLVHKIRFAVNPLREEYAQDEMEISTIESLKKMTHSLGSIENLMSASESRVNRAELGEFLHDFGEKIEAGLLAGDREDQNLISVDAIQADEAVLVALKELKDELTRNSMDEQNIVKDQMQRLLGELKEGVVAGGRQTEGLLEVFAGLKEYIGAEDQAVVVALQELKEELSKTSVDEQNIVKDQMQGLLSELKQGVIAGGRQTEGLLEVFAGFKEHIGAENQAVVVALQELKEELSKTSVDEQNIVKDQMQGLLSELKQGVIAGGRQTEGLLEVFAGLKEHIGAENQAVVVALQELKEELARASMDEQNIVRDQMQGLLGELKEGVIAGGRQTESLLEVFTGLKEHIGAEERAILAGLNELKEELSRNSVDEQNIIKDQMQQLVEGLREDAIAGGRRAEGMLEVFSGLKEDLAAESEKARQVSAEQMETLFSGLTQAAAGTLSDLSEVAGNVVSQAKWQAGSLAQEISAANEISAKSMIAMLKEILAATEDANSKITTELAKLRGDVAADLKATNDQSSALIEQLRVMTESSKASLIATVTDLKTQIAKDMKANYSLIDTYTKAVSDVTGTNQVEAMERMEAIANIMHAVVQSSSDMSSLLHDNAAAMNRMQEAFTGTNEGSLGRFLLNMNENLIEHITALQNSLDAQGSLGTLMQDMNTESNLRLKGLEKAFESSVFEIKQLPQEFVRGMSKLEMQKMQNRNI